MRKKIEDVAEVQMGYPFRARLEFKSDGILSVIQMKDLGSDNRVDCENVQKIDMVVMGDKHFVQKGDLIFRSRGVTNTAAILDRDPGSTIVAAPLLRVRVNKNMILSEYLCWYINQNASQRYLGTRQEGTHGGMISRKALSNLPVDISSLKTQAQIVELINLQNRRQNLEKKRIERQEQEITALLMKLIRGEK